MLSKQARNKLRQISDYSACRCDYIIDCIEHNGYITIQRANKSTDGYKLLKDLKPLTFRI